MTAFADTLAKHAPYVSKSSDNLLCLRCLDEAGCGEFPTAEAWAAHVEAVMASGDVTVPRARKRPPAVGAPTLFDVNEKD